MLAGIAATVATLPALPVRAAPLRYDLSPQKVADGVWLLRGADEEIKAGNGGAIANITLIGTPAGAVLIDAGPSLRYGQALDALARTLTGKPVIRVYLTHLHPDHSYGDAAFDPAIIAATPTLIEELKTEGPGFAAGMYRLLGDWMRGSELKIPGHAITADSETFGGRRLRLLPLAGHSPSDLAVLDEATGTLIAGDLVFHDRAPSTPHADLPVWRRSLDTLKALGHARVVPGHGPIDPTPATAIVQTRDWIDWVDATLRTAVAAGLDMVEAGQVAIPPRFAGMKAARYELERSVSHFYPALEDGLLPRVDVGGR